MQETYEKCQGFIRFGVQAEALRDFRAFVELSGIPPEHARGLKLAGKRRGADWRDWRVSFEPIPISDCFVEVWYGTERGWVRVQEPDAASSVPRSGPPR